MRITGADHLIVQRIKRFSNVLAITQGHQKTPQWGRWGDAIDLLKFPQMLANVRHTLGDPLRANISLL
jgi:hypothetical protein